MGGISAFLNEIIGETKNSPRSETAAAVFASNRESLGVCPRCGKNVVEQLKSYSCESGKNGCGFVVWKKMSEKTVSPAQVKKLLAKGKTDVIKGFKSKAGKPFDASLALTEKDGIKGVSFEFAPVPKNLQNDGQ